MNIEDTFEAIMNDFNGRTDSLTHSDYKEVIEAVIEELETRLESVKDELEKGAER